MGKHVFLAGKNSRKNKLMVVLLMWEGRSGQRNSTMYYLKGYMHGIHMDDERIQGHDNGVKMNTSKEWWEYWQWVAGGEEDVVKPVNSSRRGCQISRPFAYSPHGVLIRMNATATYS